MHAVVVKVTINDPEAAQTALHEQTVPRVSQAGLSMVIFESEDAAKGASERIRANAPDGVKIEDVEVREVVAHA